MAKPTLRKFREGVIIFFFVEVWLVVAVAVAALASRAVIAHHDESAICEHAARAREAK